MIDRCGRTIEYLRVSITDKCNLRCCYCMPEEGIEHIPHEEILSFEEVLRLIRISAGLGIKKIRITGGEPLVRKGVGDFLRQIKSIEGIENLSITTNGVLLEQMYEDIVKAGVDSINVSLDTLKRERYALITRRDEYDKVRRGMNLMHKAGISLKINSVICKGINDDEVTDLAALARDYDMDVRFIELMPVGCGKNLVRVDNEEIKARLISEFGEGTLSRKVHGNGPAVYYDFEGFKGSVGFISPISHKFCGDCNRIRLTAEGFLKLCLNYNRGISLKELLRSEKSDDEIKKAMEQAIYNKPVQHRFEENDSSESAGNDTEVDGRKMAQIGG